MRPQWQFQVETAAQMCAQCQVHCFIKQRIKRENIRNKYTSLFLLLLFVHTETRLKRHSLPKTDKKTDQIFPVLLTEKEVCAWEAEAKCDDFTRTESAKIHIYTFSSFLFFITFYHVRESTSHDSLSWHFFTEVLLGYTQQSFVAGILGKKTYMDQNRFNQQNLRFC